MREKCPLKEIQERSGKLLDRWALKVDSAFEKAGEGLDKAAKWADENIPFAGELLDVRGHAKEIDELLGEYHRTTAAIYTQAGQFKEYLGKLSLGNRKAMFKALDGEMDPGELPEYVRPLYEKVRKTIDDGAQALVDAGALEGKNVIKDYVKHYYKKTPGRSQRKQPYRKGAKAKQIFCQKTDELGAKATARDRGRRGFCGHKYNPGAKKATTQSSNSKAFCGQICQRCAA